MKKVLIIEDDVFLGDVLKQKLLSEGYEVSLARDGAEGYKAIKEFKPDLILLDIVMPNMNGYEVLESKAKDNEIKDIPVIVVSNSGQPVEIDRALALGVKDYLVKASFDPEEVMVKVRAQLFGEKPAASTPTAHPKGKQRLLNKTILWVEDDKFLKHLIIRKVSTEGCDLKFAESGEEAFEILKTVKPDIAVLDILLPDMDGFEILKRIKENPDTKSVPVVLLSNLGQQSDIEKGTKLGANRFLIKATISFDEIITQVSDVLKESGTNNF